MKIYFDTEFIERGYRSPIELISIGMVAENGDEFYAVNSDLAVEKIEDHSWLKYNVLPHLPVKQGEAYEGIMWDDSKPELMPRNKIRDSVYTFLLDHSEVFSTPIELWAWYGAYDHVVLAQLWNTMSELPDPVPMYTNDLRQELTRLENLGHKGLSYNLPKDDSQEHHALADARLLKKRAEWLAATTRT